MDTKTWEKMTTSIIEGYQNMNPHSKATPDWWILEIIDDFGAYLASKQAIQLRYYAKILTVKEEGDTSYVCQAYDAQVAKLDKRST